MNPVPDLSFSVIKIFAAMALVIGLLLLVNWLKTGKIGRRPASGIELEMLGAITLGMKKSIALVKVADRILVVGIGQERIQLLDKIEDAEKIAGLENQDSTQAGGFGRQLKRLLRQNSRPAVSEDSGRRDDLQVG